MDMRYSRNVGKETKEKWADGEKRQMQEKERTGERE